MAWATESNSSSRDTGFNCRIFSSPGVGIIGSSCQYLNEFFFWDFCLPGLPAQDFVCLCAFCSKVYIPGIITKIHIVLVLPAALQVILKNAIAYGKYPFWQCRKMKFSLGSMGYTASWASLALRESSLEMAKWLAPSSHAVIISPTEIANEVCIKSWLMWRN